MLICLQIPTILNRWKNYFPQTLDVYRPSDVRQIEIHATEALGPDPRTFEFEIPMQN
jgi:hypothetical protein